MDWLNLLVLIAAWAALGTAFLYVCARLFGGSPVFGIACAVFVAGFMARVIVIMLNEEFAFFEQKLAGGFALDLYQDYVLQGRGWSNLIGHEFGLQVLINTPVWLLLGVSRTALLISNATMGALAAPLACVLLLKDYQLTAAKRSLLFFSIYPAGFNFSIFGLRDPIIYLGMIVLAVAAIRMWASGVNLSGLVLMTCGSLAVLSSRPELAYVVVGIAMLPVMNAYVNMVMTALSSRNALASLLLMTIPILLLAVSVGAAATGLAARNIGSKTLNPADIATQNADERFARSEEALGGGSHIMSGDMYMSLPWYLRVPVQTAGLILLPFPWAVTSVPRLMAFADSCFLISLASFALVNMYFSEPLRRRGTGRLLMFLLLIALVGFLGLGFIVINFGNGFRMRLAITPLLMLAAIVCPIRVRISLFGRRQQRSQVMAAA